MAHLIDKDALVAEIERMMAEEMAMFEESLKDDSHEISAAPVVYTRLQMLLSAINTLEVKDVDLEHEVESYWKQCDMTWCRDAYSMTHIRSMLSDIAKHFFALGMAVSNKAQKGEEV